MAKKQPKDLTVMDIVHWKVLKEIRDNGKLKEFEEGMKPEDVARVNKMMLQDLCNDGYIKGDNEIKPEGLAHMEFVESCGVVWLDEPMQEQNIFSYSLN